MSIAVQVGRSSSLNIDFMFFQHFSSSVMLRSMLIAAVNWIEAGLPLKKFSIVVYTRRPDDHYPAERDLADLFENFKTNFMKKKRAKKSVGNRLLSFLNRIRRTLKNIFFSRR